MLDVIEVCRGKGKAFVREETNGKQTRMFMRLYEGWCAEKSEGNGELGILAMFAATAVLVERWEGDGVPAEWPEIKSFDDYIRRSQIVEDSLSSSDIKRISDQYHDRTYVDKKTEGNSDAP